MIRRPRRATLTDTLWPFTTRCRSWRWQARRVREPGDIGKIAIGSALTGAAAALFALASALYLPGRVPALVAVLPFAGMGVAFLYFWPTLLALISQAAPPRVNATLMGGAFLSLFVGRSEEHTSELQSLMRISYAVFCLKKKK